MFNEFVENTIVKAKEDIAIARGMLILIALVSFILGIIVGILCSEGSKSDKKKKKSNSSLKPDTLSESVGFEYDFGEDGFNDYEYLGDISDSRNSGYNTNF